MPHGEGRRMGSKRLGESKNQIAKVTFKRALGKSIHSIVAKDRQICEHNETLLGIAIGLTYIYIFSTVRKTLSITSRLLSRMPF